LTFAICERKNAFGNPAKRNKRNEQNMKIKTSDKASAATQAAMQNEWLKACANEAEFLPAELWLAVVLMITPQAAREMFERDTINALAIISQ
jgi:hypothetical protein